MEREHEMRLSQRLIVCILASLALGAFSLPANASVSCCCLGTLGCCEQVPACIVCKIQCGGPHLCPGCAPCTECANPDELAADVDSVETVEEPEAGDANEATVQKPSTLTNEKEAETPFPG